MKALTPNQKECLQALACYPDEWVAPIDLGAWDGSFHSGTLRRLAIKGLVLRRFRGHQEPQEPWEIIHSRPTRTGVRGSCVYKISDQGRAVLKREAA